MLSKFKEVKVLMMVGFAFLECCVQIVFHDDCRERKRQE